MSKMPCGVTADLRAHEAGEARAERKYDRWVNRARESIVDDLMRGERVGQIVLFDILDGHDFFDTADVVAIVINRPGVRDDTIAISKHAARNCALNGSKPLRAKTQ